MDTKIKNKEASDQQLKAEINEIKSWKSQAPKDSRLSEIAKHFAALKQWDSAFEALELISNEKERNLLIADIIEGSLIPSMDIPTAKKFAKFLTPVIEIEPFIWIKIALAEGDADQAQKIAERLPSPISRNFAFLHIMESYLSKKQMSKANPLFNLMVENIKTIYDQKSRSYILRELALNLFMANKAKDQAIEMAMLIPDAEIKTQVMNKINLAK